MAEEQTNNPQEDSKESIEPKLPTVEKPKEIVESKPKSSTEESNAPKPQEQSQPIIFQSQKEKKEGWTIGNIIAAISVIVNVILIYFTFNLWREAVASTNVAKSSAWSSEKSAQQAIEANKIAENNYKLAQEQFKSSDSANNKTIELAIQSLSSQIKFTSLADSSFNISKKYAARSDSNYIKSINIATNLLDVSKESLTKVQKNFETENKAIIFMKHFNADTIKANRYTSINIRLQNFGKSPTILTEVLREIVFDTAFTLSNEKFKYPVRGYSFINLFMSANGTFDFNLSLIPLTQGDINLLRGKKWNVFVFGEAFYYDIVRRATSSYQFCFRLNPDGTFEVPPNHNMIIEGKDPPKK